MSEIAKNEVQDAPQNGDNARNGLGIAALRSGSLVYTVESTKESDAPVVEAVEPTSE